MTTEIQELKEILTGFISEQKKINEVVTEFIIEQRIFNKSVSHKFFNIDRNFIEFTTEQKAFNEEQRDFNEEQRVFNQDMIAKIDKAQYFLEESLAQNTKIFFEEQSETRVTVKELEDEVFHIKNDMMNFSSQLKTLMAH